jgi:type IX secretion system protein PorV
MKKSFKKMIKRGFGLFLVLISTTITLLAQDPNLGGNSTLGQDLDKDNVNTITTAVPFLMIAPDSRAGAMGDVGVATTPDANSIHWNPAKLAFIDKDLGLSISYIPWLRNLVDDINLAYLSGFKRVDENQVIAASLLYFTLGNITFTNRVGDVIGTFDPHEFAFDVAYARSFSRVYSMGMAARYIHSNLTGGQDDSEITKPGNSFAMDVSAYYNNDITIGDYDSKIAGGLNISNIGRKIDYTGNNKNFIPINMRLGTGLTMIIDEYNSIGFALDFNKLLVPTPPQYDTNDDDELYIIYGKDPNVSVPVGIFQSFYDAPGVPNGDGSRSVLREELREVSYSFGTEYWYANQFAIRAG